MSSSIIHAFGVNINWWFWLGNPVPNVFVRFIRKKGAKQKHNLLPLTKPTMYSLNLTVNIILLISCIR